MRYITVENELDITRHYLDVYKRQVQARIPEVVIGCMNPKAGCAGSILNILENPAFNHQVKVTRGILEQQCSDMLTQFFKELRVRVKEERRERKQKNSQNQ